MINMLITTLALLAFIAIMLLCELSTPPDHVPLLVSILLGFYCDSAIVGL